MPEEPTFKIGDQVRHKSGGPVMIVSQSPNTNGGVTCEWFNGKSGSISSQQFNQAVLTPFVKPEPKPAEPKPPIVFPFKEGDKVRSNTGTAELTVGVIPPNTDPRAQVACHWVEPAIAAVEAVEASEGKPAVPAISAKPEVPHVTMFWPSQLTLINPSSEQA